VPLIGVTACTRFVDRHVVHGAAAQYVEAVAAGAGGAPVILPALASRTDFDAVVARLDGLLLTGSPSNVQPERYGGEPARPGTLQDPARDATTLPLIRRAIEDGLPLLAICRGHQELNVALGGSLHQHVHELPGRADHRAPADEPNEKRYAFAHSVRLVSGGVLAGLASTDEVVVNSLHSQAIDRLADGLVIEATSPDGVIEAVRVATAKSFALGVQWHPEWHIAADALSRAIFAAFGEAARDRARRRAAAR